MVKMELRARRLQAHSLRDAPYIASDCPLLNGDIQDLPFYNALPLILYASGLGFGFSEILNGMLRGASRAQLSPFILIGFLYTSLSLSLFPFNFQTKQNNLYYK